MLARVAVGGLLCLAMTACQGAAPRFDPQDPVVLGAVDSLMTQMMDAAARRDADGVLAAADGDRFTFVVGDVMLHGADAARRTFQATYDGLQSQEHVVHEKRVQALAPDVALLTAVGEGTYTTTAGQVSDPVGLGFTAVFVRIDGQWRLRHVHQSVIK
jgi:uncharacterized protein (TIGR02246 family)